MKFQVFKTLVFFVFMISATSCEKSDVKDRPLEAAEEIDVAYGLHEQNELDVYLPAGRSDTTKVIILLHGGGWIEGDKDSLSEYALHFRDRGFAVVNMNYRLAVAPDSNAHPTQEQDIAAAVDFVTSKAIDWNISKDKFAMVGVSAGAHLALLYTYIYNTNGKIKTVISLAGPTNLTDAEGVEPAQAAAVRTLMGVDFNEVNLPQYIQASPLARVNSLSKPTLIIHGKNDETVPIKQSRDLHAKLTQLNVINELIEVPGVGHDIFNDSNREELLEAIEVWFRENIK